MTDARVMCAEPSCPQYLLADPRHFDNLTGRYRCPTHHKDTR